MGRKPLTLEAITALVRPLAKNIMWRKSISSAPMQGARHICPKRSGFSCFWQRWISSHWDPPEILSLGEELQEFLQKKVDIFEIREVNPDSDFYHTIMKEKVLVAWCNLSHTISFRVTDDEKHLIQSVLRGIASSDRFFLHQGSRPWPAWRGRELEEARILKVLELSHKERVYDLEKVL